MENTIYPCFTIKGKIAEAADYYMNIFGEGTIVQKSPFVIQIELSGQKFMLLNDGPTSTPNPTISFMVIGEAAQETEEYWNKLIEGGSILMPLDSYDWSPKYGWIQDKYGVSWQLYTGEKNEDTPQKFSPTLMFVREKAGKASEAVHFYTQVFPHSKIHGILKYSESDGERTDFVKHAQFTIRDFIAMAMDSSMDHDFDFNDAISLVVECETQAEIDSYWEQLTADGGAEVMCGWLTDKYGVSWQVIPKTLGQLMQDTRRAPRVMNALMHMKKLIISDLENA